MSLPLNALSTLAAPASFLWPDSIIRASLLEDWEMGGVALSDPTQGLMVQTWRAFMDGDTVMVEGETVAAAPLFTLAGLSEITLAFNQNMDPLIAYVENGSAKLWWYDPVPEDYAVFNLPADALSPRLTLDDKRDGASGFNDALLFYIRSSNLCYRQQRERFTVERTLASVPGGSTRIRRCGMSAGLRLQIEFDVTSQAAHTDLLTDVLYFAHGTSVRPMFAVDNRTGVWRSPRLLAHEHPSFGWLRVNSGFEASITVSLYGDGVLWFSVIVSSLNPVRLPPGRFKSMEVEVTSTAPVKSVTLTSSGQELALTVVRE
jgi:hypothetical protein